MKRPQAIMFAYEDCARAIYQSWGVIGLGLFSFAFSSFTPTQRFGNLMFTMLTASSVGNLVLLPALLAGPAGNFFWRAGEKAIARHGLKEQPENEPEEDFVVRTDDRHCNREQNSVIPLPSRQKRTPA